MEQNLSQKIIRNTAYNTVGRFWNVIVVLFLTPYIIARIGNERFGIWSIAGVITGYFGLLDFGVGTSFVKYIAEFQAKQDHRKINQVINTGILFYLIFTLIVVICLVFFLPGILALFKIPLHLHSETVVVFLIGLILFGLSNTLSPFGAVQIGFQRMDIATKVAIVVSMFNIAGTIFFLEKGHGLVGLMMNNAILFVINSIFNIIIAFRLLPELRLSPSFFDKTMFAELFHFGYKLQVSRFANLISFQSDKLFITYFLGIGLVTFYQLGNSVLSQARQIPLLLVSALVPAVSEMEALQGKRSLKELYLKGSKYLMFISVPLTVYMMSSAPLIMLIWMGQGYSLAVLVIQVMAWGYFAATITGVASAIAMGVAKTELDMKFGIIMAVLNIFLNIILAVKMGFFGVAIGTASALLIASIFYLKMFHGYLECPISDFIRLLYKPLSASFVPGLGIVIFNKELLHLLSYFNRFLNLAIFIMMSLLFFAAYVIFISLSKYFDGKDKDFLKTKIPALKYLIF